MIVSHSSHYWQQQLLPSRPFYVCSPSVALPAHSDKRLRRFYPMLKSAGCAAWRIETCSPGRILGIRPHLKESYRPYPRRHHSSTVLIVACWVGFKPATIGLDRVVDIVFAMLRLRTLLASHRRLNYSWVSDRGYCLIMSSKRHPRKDRQFGSSA